MKAVAEAKQEAQGYQSDGRGLDDRTCSHSEFDMCSSLSHIYCAKCRFELKDRLNPVRAPSWHQRLSHVAWHELLMPRQVRHVQRSTIVLLASISSRAQ